MQNKMDDKKYNCFVIMPFSKTTEERTKSYWTEHYEKFLKLKIEEYNGIIVERAKAVRGDIVREIISNLISADIVVADLTDNNPNVYWELGVRQSFKHGTITIAEIGTQLPFDISGKGTLFYHPKDHIKNAEFEKELHNALKDCIENPNRPDSHVMEAVTGRGSFYEIIHREEIGRRIIALGNEYKINLRYYNQILNRAKTNQKESKEIYPTTLMRLPAIELLIANRYLTASDEAYDIAEQYYDHLNSINERILMWPNRADAVEKWLIKTMDDKKYLKKFSEEIVKTIQSIK